MSRTKIICSATSALVVSGAVILYLVVMAGREEPQWIEPSPADYSTAKDADEIMQREYARFMQMHLSGERYRLRTRAQNILDHMHTVNTEHEFRLLAVQQCYEALAANAEQFKLDNPAIWQAATAAPAGDGRDLCTLTVAALPYALCAQSVVDAIESSDFVRRIEQKYGKEYFDANGASVVQDDVAFHETEAQDFLARSEVLSYNLESALSKQRVYYPTKPGFDPNEPFSLPWPLRWDAMMQLRVQVLALRGERVEARRAVFAMLELFERAEMTKSLLGALMQVVMVDRYIAKIVVPCALAGALTADDLDEIYRRGQAIGFDVGSGFSFEVSYCIVQYLSPSWSESRGLGTAGIPDLLMKSIGKVGVDGWLEGIETQYPKHIDVFEAEMSAMHSGGYVLRNEDDFERCLGLWDRVVVPFVGAQSDGNLIDMYVSQLRWTELVIRAKEIRDGKPLRDWDDPLAPFKHLRGLRPVIQADGVGLRLDAEYFSSVGVEVTRDQTEFLVRFSHYEKNE